MPPKVERIPVEFPQTKQGIEQAVAGGFARDVRNHPSAQEWFGEFHQNVEDDLDFDVTAPDGSVWKLELTEVVPVPFNELDESARVHKYMTLDFVDCWLDAIAKKSAHYGNVRGTRQILLIYTTDWRFILTTDVADVVRQELSGQPQAFDYIYAWRPVSADEGEVIVLFPPPPEWVPWTTRASLGNQESTIINVPKSAFRFHRGA